MVRPSNALKAVKNGFKLTKILMKEDMKFFSNDKNVTLVLTFALMLLSLKQGYIFE